MPTADNRASNGTQPSVFDDTEEITRRFRVAVREALLDHKRAGNPVAVWRDGKVVMLSPEEIPETGLDTIQPDLRKERDS